MRTVCITADGVLIRFLVDGQIVSEARSVRYGPQPAELFRCPRATHVAGPPKVARCIDRHRGANSVIWHRDRARHRLALKSPISDILDNLPRPTDDVQQR